MTKRVALARALALDPAIVFLDEPTSVLDPIAAGDFDALIKTLQKALGLTVFMVTHDLASLNTVCDRVAALADGKIVAIGPMRELLQSASVGAGLFPGQAFPDAAIQSELDHGNPRSLRRCRRLRAGGDRRRIWLHLLAAKCRWSRSARDLPRPVRRLGARAVGWRCGAVQRHPRRRSLRARSRAG